MSAPALHGIRACLRRRRRGAPDPSRQVRGGAAYWSTAHVLGAMTVVQESRINSWDPGRPRRTMPVSDAFLRRCFAPVQIIATRLREDRIMDEAR